MVYGSADYMRVPWETIIKLFRSHIGQDKFDTIEEYGKKFVDYVNTHLCK